MPFLLALPQRLLSPPDAVPSVVTSSVVVVPKPDMLGIEALLISAIFFLVLVALDQPRRGAGEADRRPGRRDP